MHRSESLNCKIITSYHIFLTIRHIHVFKKQFLEKNTLISQVQTKQNVTVDHRPVTTCYGHCATVTPIMVQTSTAFKKSVI